MTANTKDVSVLNTLIATLLDSVDGFQKSAGDSGRAPARAQMHRGDL